MRTNNRRLLLALLGLGILPGCQILGPKRSEPAASGPEVLAPSQWVSQARSAELGAVGRFYGEMVCTGFWLDLPQRLDSPALFVTNGHCVQDWQQRESAWTVLRQVSPKTAWNVVFRLFHDAPHKQQLVPVREVVYSTMRGLDVAILQLGVSVGQLREWGLKPLPLAPVSPNRGEPIRIFGIPIAKAQGASSFLREHRCREGQRTDLIEWTWYWSEMHANNCADIVEGSSGSPMLNSKGQVFGMINTTSRGSRGQACALGQPCEVTRDGVKPRPDTNYGVSLVTLAGCWQNQGWQWENPSCLLPRPLPFAVQVAGPTVFGKHSPAASWPLQVNGEQQMVRTLTGRAERVRCQDPDAYGPAVALRSLRASSLTVGREEGIYLHCLWPQSPHERYPLRIVAHVDHTPPLGEPTPELLVFPDSLSLQLPMRAPEWASYRYSVGPLGVHDCRKLPLKQWPGRPLRLVPQQLPAKFCVQVLDQAENASQLYEWKISQEGRLGR